SNIVTNLEKDLLEIKQVDQYAQALFFIPAIVDCYFDNKLGEAIQKAIVANNLDCREEAHAEKRDYIEHAIVANNLDCREEAHAEKRDYIEHVDTSMRAILKEEVNTQHPQILPQTVLDFATPVIEKNETESLEVAVLARSFSQPKSTYEAAASLFEYELTKILIDKMEKNKSYNKANYKRELCADLVKSYQTDKDLFDTYGEPSGKSAHGEEPSHIVHESGVQQDQEFDTGNNDEQPTDKEDSKADWLKKFKRPPTPDSDWNKRQHVDSRPP
nr:hypothetical protein [Tanacetum cinerariifolium]